GFTRCLLASLPVLQVLGLEGRLRLRWNGSVSCTFPRAGDVRNIRWRSLRPSVHRRKCNYKKDGCNEPLLCHDITPVLVLICRPLETTGGRNRKLLLFAISERYFQQQPPRIPVQKRRGHGRHLIACLDHIGPPTRSLEHINTGALE